jgi:hypothetical protein
MARESEVMHAVLKRWGAHPRLRLVRTNVGAGWFANGQPARKTDPGAYPVYFNPEGWGDYTGLCLPLGLPDDFQFGVFTMLEGKSTKGRQREAQKRVERMVLSLKGIYILAASVEAVDRRLIPLIGPPPVAESSR